MSAFFIIVAEDGIFSLYSTYVLRPKDSNYLFILLNNFYSIKL